ncbi:MAG: DUF3990 domain-containing protein [Candidatus Ancillula sp.]|jgi:hypothetical protein|nr:DUF3990 domain-containing protein [Candidatus Ancillula sp.]
MILYHGSYLEVRVPDLSKCKKYKDFGQGFYLTTLVDQAKEWSKKVSRRNLNAIPTLNVFEFDDSRMPELNTLTFDDPTGEWGLFIINNRDANFTNDDDKLSNQNNKYDLVHGLVANDDISAIFETFMLGVLPIEELKNALKYKKLNDQYSFHTKRALNLLTFIKSETIHV